MLQKLTSKARRIIEDYNLIEDNDKIAVGVSGGKDSIALLYVLHNLQRFYKKFEIVAITINPGIENFDTTNITKICNELNIKHVVHNSDIFEIIFNIRKEKNPCSLCANLRRGILCSLATENNCNKIALGHHQDDLTETLLMNIFLNGNITTFAPISTLTRSNLSLIRPLLYIEEKEIRQFIKKYDIEIMPKTCPYDGTTKREYTKNLICDIKKDIPKVKENLLGAIKRSNIKGW